MTYVSAEAMKFRGEVKRRVLETGFEEILTENVGVGIKLFPNRPKDWPKRVRLHGNAWVDTVRRVDLDNSIKTLLDSFKGLVFLDDKQVTLIVARICTPDEFGARVEVCVFSEDRDDE